MPEYVVPAALDAGLPQSSLEKLFEGMQIGDYSSVDGINPTIEAAVRAAVKTSYSLAFKVVFLVSITFGSLFIIASLICPNVEEYLTGEVARKLVKGQPPESDEESPRPETTTTHGVMKSEELKE